MQKNFKLIRAFDVAYMLGLSVEKTMRLGREGKIPGAVVIDRYVQFNPDVVNEFIRSGGVRSIKPPEIKAARRVVKKSILTLNRSVGTRPEKALRFDRRQPGALARYKPVRFNSEDDHFPKHPSGNWNADLKHPALAAADRSTDTYQITSPVEPAYQQDVRVIELLLNRQAPHSELSRSTFPDPPVRPAGELEIKPKQICA